MYVKVPKDITEYEGKVIKGLSMRMIVFSTIAVLSGIILTYVLSGILKISGSIVSFVVMGSSVPIFMVGIMHKDGIPMDKWLMYAFDYMLYSKNCLYDTEIGGEMLAKNKKRKRRDKEEKIDECEG